MNGICSNTKQSELSLLFNKYHIDVAVITETHLTEIIDDRRIMQAGYSFIRRDQNFTAVTKSKEGGVIIYLKSSIAYIEPKLRMPDELEVFRCILKPSLPNNIILADIYISPDACSAYRQMLMDHLVATVDMLRSPRPRT